MKTSNSTFLLLIGLILFRLNAFSANQRFCGNMLQFQPETIKYENGAPGVMCLNPLPNNTFAVYIEHSNKLGSFRSFGYGFRTQNMNSNEFVLSTADIRKNTTDGNRTGRSEGYGNLPRWSTNSSAEFISSFVITRGQDLTGGWFTAQNGSDYVTDRTKFSPQLPPLISNVKGQWRLGKCNTLNSQVRVYTTLLPDRMVKRCVFEDNKKVLAWISFGVIWNKPFVELGGGNDVDIFGNREYRVGRICAEPGLECGDVYKINSIQFSIEPNGQEKQTVTYGNGTVEDWLYNIDI